MEKFSKNTNGITLVALVVTIIILLILAAVSLNLVAGENGILSRAEKASEETIKATAKEEVELELANYLSLYYDEKYLNKDDNNKTKGKTAGKYIKDEVESEKITSSGYKYTIGEKEEGKNYYPVNIYDKNKILLLTGRLNDDGKLILSNLESSLKPESSPDSSDESQKDDKNKKETLLGKITADNYGDIVIYNANEVSEWKIFYKDLENVYLISSSYIPVSKLQTIKNKTGMTTGGTYNVNWNSVPSNMSTGWNTKKDKYLLSKYDSSWDSNNNMKVVSTLLNTENWNEFVDSQYADWAIGGTTIEMYVASWNEKGYTPLYCNNSNTTGYYVGTSSESKGNGVNMTASEGYSDKLYYPYERDYDGCYGYWFASPSSGSADHVMRIYTWDGDVGCTTYSTNYGIRPVVCLNSDVNGTSTTTDNVTTWTLSK